MNQEFKYQIRLFLKTQTKLTVEVTAQLSRPKEQWLSKTLSCFFFGAPSNSVSLANKAEIAVAPKAVRSPKKRCTFSMFVYTAHLLHASHRSLLPAQYHACASPSSQQGLPRAPYSQFQGVSNLLFGSSPSKGRWLRCVAVVHLPIQHIRLRLGVFLATGSPCHCDPYSLIVQTTICFQRLHWNVE